MDVKLVVVGGKNAGRAIPVTGDKFYIGRADDCQLRPNSDLVSRHHCVIMVEDDFVSVRDFGSRNGTLVNGERIRGEEDLNSGDHLIVGPLEFEVLIQVPQAIKDPQVEKAPEAVVQTVEIVLPKSTGDDNPNPAVVKKSAQAMPQKASRDDELDIGDWLSDGDEAGDTRSGESSQTETVPMKPAVTPVHKPQVYKPDPSPESESETKEKDTTKQKGPHTLKRPKAIDSKAAAEDTLRAFFNRR